MTDTNATLEAISNSTMSAPTMSLDMFKISVLSTIIVLTLLYQERLTSTPVVDASELGGIELQYGTEAHRQSGEKLASQIVEVCAESIEVQGGQLIGVV